MRPVTLHAQAAHSTRQQSAGEAEQAPGVERTATFHSLEAQLVRAASRAERSGALAYMCACV